MITLEQSQLEIQKVCQEMSDFLSKKNLSYDNSFTKDIVYPWCRKTSPFTAGIQGTGPS